MGPCGRWGYYWCLVGSAWYVVKMEGGFAGYVVDGGELGEIWSVEWGVSSEDGGPYSDKRRTGAHTVFARMVNDESTYMDPRGLMGWFASQTSRRLLYTEEELPKVVNAVAAVHVEHVVRHNITFIVEWTCMETMTLGEGVTGGCYRRRVLTVVGVLTVT
ncbi:hypothetical protein V496_01213 [Pseudogymnoascus sp. VKM F-4515 (FW-2607)]|nr:hypothetical protein V496_01213 [Pseudogymnoascus sp. VKM F-4515 (FW-2607)]